jgi:NagD protein
MQKLGTHRSETAIIGDRMDTDIIAGIESELDSVLVLSGVTAKSDLSRFPFSPAIVLNGIGDLPPSGSEKK